MSWIQVEMAVDGHNFNSLFTSNGDDWPSNETAVGFNDPQFSPKTRKTLLSSHLYCGNEIRSDAGTIALILH